MHLNYRKKFQLFVLVILLSVIFTFTIINLTDKRKRGFNENLSDPRNPQKHDFYKTISKKDVDNKWIVAMPRDKTTLATHHITTNLESFSIIQVKNKANKLDNAEFSLLTEHITYLDEKLQRLLNYELHLSPQIASFKNIGYLLAIERGAEFIYDCENLPDFDIESHFIMRKNDYGLIINDNCSDNGKRLVNPISHVSQNDGNDYILGPRRVSGIQQTIILENMELFESPQSFQLSNYKMALFDSKNTLFHYQEFWALYLPSSVLEDSERDLLRSLWSQRLMWLLNETITFLGPPKFSKLGNNKQKNNN